jgi:hypothetical protein
MLYLQSRVFSAQRPSATALGLVQPDEPLILYPLHQGERLVSAQRGDFANVAVTQGVLFQSVEHPGTDVPLGQPPVHDVAQAVQERLVGGLREPIITRAPAPADVEELLFVRQPPQLLRHDLHGLLADLARLSRVDPPMARQPRGQRGAHAVSAQRLPCFLVASDGSSGVGLPAEPPVVAQHSRPISGFGPPIREIPC